MRLVSPLPPLGRGATGEFAENSALCAYMTMPVSEYVCNLMVVGGIWHQDCVTPAAEPEDTGAIRSLDSARVMVAANHCARELH
jgi:hypothetical protein